MKDLAVCSIMNISGPVLIETCKGQTYEFGSLKEFVIGRSPNVNLTITETCISRNQCVIKSVPGGEWLIVDNSSFKSTLVNTAKISSIGLYLKSGDVITFSSLSNFKLTFYESEHDVPPSTKRRRLNVGAAFSSQGSHRSASRSPVRSERSRSTFLTSIIETSNALETAKDEDNKRSENNVVELQERIEHLEADKNRADEVVVTLHVDHMEFLSAFEDMKSELGRLVSERDALQKELTETTKMLETCGASRPESIADTEMTTELIIKTLEAEESRKEFNALKTQCDYLKSSNDVLRSNNDDIVAVLEQEFNCCVCSDLLFEPVTLNCRHTFCKTCVNEWKTKKKDCPTCRTKIKSEVSAIMVDSFLDRVAPLLGEDFVKKREEARKDHNLRCNPPPRSPVVDPISAPRPSAGGRGRGTRGARRGGRRSGPYVPPPPNSVPAPTPHVLDVIDLTSGVSPQARNRRRRT